MPVAHTAIRVGFGAASAAAVPGRTIVSAGLRAARTGWESPLSAPVRHPVTVVLRAAEERGARVEPAVAAEARASLHRLVESVLSAPWTREAARRAIASPATQEALDEALRGPVIDQVVRELTAQPTIERLAAAVDRQAVDGVVARLLDDPALEQLLSRVLASRFADAATDQLLASDELQRVVAHIAQSDQVRDALAHQSETMAGEVAEGLRDRTATVDDRLERSARRLLRRRPRVAPVVELPGGDAPA